jgi:hypothetical protein
MAEHIVVSVKDRVLHLQLERLEKKNALTRGMYLGMAEAVRQAEADPGVRVAADHRYWGLLHCRKRPGGFRQRQTR